VGGHPVKPVVIRYPYTHFSPTYESIKGVPHILRLFAQFRNYCQVEFLPVYYPSEVEKKDPKLFADNVRQVLPAVKYHIRAII
jgi:lysophosphatidylcholine acyltransferase/lyso-PAF acetyltransferase